MTQSTTNGQPETEKMESGKIENDKLNVEQAVRKRYSAASQEAEPALCCPVDYEKKYLEVLPSELIERDYGCGDPSKYVFEGETVLDLGSGGGKICYIASQVVGPQGRVFGVDMNDDMLALARKHQGEIAQKIGHDNVEFFKGKIQDLALDYEQFQRYLSEHPVQSAEDWLAAEAHAENLRHTRPMIADDSIDVIVSNCVLNLVEQSDREMLIDQMHRVLKRGGRVVISDIVCDELVPQELRNDPQLWSGCISGAFLEDRFLQAFEEAGFYGIEILERQDEPWAIVEGIEFRSLTLRAYKGKDGPCRDHHQAVIYKGPWKKVVDDDGHTLRRGERMAVCEKTFQLYTQKPYKEQVIAVEPLEEVQPEDALPFDCRDDTARDPKVTKGRSFKKTLLPISDCCGPEDCC